MTANDQPQPEYHDTPCECRGEGEDAEVATWATSTCTMTNGKQVITSCYNAEHLIRNRKPGPGWVSYLRWGVFYTKFSTTTPEFLVSL